MKLQRALFIAGLFCLVAGAASAADNYLFAYFKSNGETGVFYALSHDGYHWETTNGENAWIPVEEEGELMRDPKIARGPDGTYHLVWTWNWRGSEFGYASSKDLVHWTKHRRIAPFRGREGVVNVWAPEVFYDAKREQWLIYWSSTIKGSYPETEGQGSNLNHRLYYVTTKDFVTFSEAKVLLEPGFTVIDGAIFQNGNSFGMVIKDERETPLRKLLQIVTAPIPEGPWSKPGDPITPAWFEGPSVMKIGGDWIVYCDHYRKPQYYGGFRSKDLRHWTNVSEQMSFPAGSRHGCFLKISDEEAARLRKGR